MNIVIITGASSGIGMEFALQMDKAFTNIDEFWLISRNQEKLERVAKKMSHITRIFPFDLTNDCELEQLENMIIMKHGIVRVLINSAGFGLIGNVETMDTKRSLGMIRLNCEALTNMTQRLIPYMRKGSRIIQMSSSAAFVPQPGFAIYAASKSYVLSFSKALAAELSAKKIYVTCVCPGPVDTAFFDVAEQVGKTLSIKKIIMLPADRVVKHALRDSYAKRQLSICGFPMQGFHIVTKLIPHDIIIKVTSFLQMYSNK